jgi:chaperone modulatory protein CbpM
MKIEVTEVTWLDEPVEYSLEELAERSHLTRAELEALIDCGAIASRDGRALQVASTAARLRGDFEVDLHGIALAMTLLRRIQELEDELCALRARVPRAP